MKLHNSCLSDEEPFESSRKRQSHWNSRRKAQHVRDWENQSGDIGIEHDVITSLARSLICDRRDQRWKSPTTRSNSLAKITVAVTGNVTTGPTGKACRNSRSGNPEQKICKHLDTEAQVFLYHTRASIAYEYLPDTNENIISDKQSQSNCTTQILRGATGLI